MTENEALELLTHRCRKMRLLTRIKPEMCELRKKLATNNKASFGSKNYYEMCIDCPGPIPLNPENLEKSIQEQRHQKMIENAEIKSAKPLKLVVSTIEVESTIESKEFPIEQESIEVPKDRRRCKKEGKKVKYQEWHDAIFKLGIGEAFTIPIKVEIPEDADGVTRRRILKNAQKAVSNVHYTISVNRQARNMFRTKSIWKDGVLFVTVIRTPEAKEAPIRIVKNTQEHPFHSKEHFLWFQGMSKLKLEESFTVFREFPENTSMELKIKTAKGIHKYLTRLYPKARKEFQDSSTFKYTQEISANSIKCIVTRVPEKNKVCEKHFNAFIKSTPFLTKEQQSCLWMGWTGAYALYCAKNE